MLLVTGRIYQMPAIRGQQRPHGAASGRGEDIFLTCTQIAPRNLPQRKAQIVAEAAIFARIVKIAATGVINRTERIMAVAAWSLAVVVRLGELYAAAALNGIRPELKSREV